jgi:anti-sigma regulatory factor (Ser/Thr protein kinase)
MSPSTERVLYERALPAAPGCVAQMRGELRAALGEAEVDPERGNDIERVLTEAAGNAVAHAYPAQPPGLLFVDAAITGRNLLLRVCDCGRGMPPPANIRGRGLGLPLMSRLADGIEIAPNRSVAGTRVSAMFRDVTEDDAPEPRPHTDAADADPLWEYVAALKANTAALRDDTRVLMAAAQHALDHADHLRAERVR